MFKNARKIIMGATLALVMGVSVVGVNAETAEGSGPLETETEINITVDEGEIEIPTDPEGGGDPEKPEKIKGNLAIWSTPKTMNFVGTYREEGFTLDMEENETRNLGIADIRPKTVGWTLSAELDDLMQDGEKVIGSDNKVTLIADSKASKYIMEDGKATVIDPDDDNGVTVEDQVSINHDSKEIMVAPNDESSRPGKNYTDLALNNIKLKFDDKMGLNGEFSSKVLWTLSDTAK